MKIHDEITRENKKLPNDYLNCNYTHPRGIVKSDDIYCDVKIISLDKYKTSSSSFDIIFLEGYHLKSRIVQYLTYSPFSHVGILLDKNIYSSFAEIIPKKGFEIGSIEKYRNYNGNIFVGRVKHHDSQDISIKDEIMRKFDNVKYENFLSVKVIEKFIRRKTTKYNKRRFICSDLIKQVFKELDWHLNSRVGDFVYPSDIEKTPIVEIIFKLDL